MEYLHDYLYKYICHLTKRCSSSVLDNVRMLVDFWCCFNAFQVLFDVLSKAAPLWMPAVLSKVEEFCPGAFLFFFFFFPWEVLYTWLFFIGLLLQLLITIYATVYQMRRRAEGFVDF